MKTYIAILRGINVSGKNKIRMKDLAEVLIRSELRNVKTYIQSGNIIFEHVEKPDSFFEKKTKVAATTRNWKTCNKLLDMSG